MQLNCILCLPSGEEGEKPEGETAAEGGETAEKEEGEEGSKSPVPQVEFYSFLHWKKFVFHLETCTNVLKDDKC